MVADRVHAADGLRGEALLVDDGSIVAAGSEAELRPRADSVEVMKGVIVPGLRDAHFHPVTYAASLVVPSLKAARNFSEIGEQLRMAAAGLPPEAPVSAIRLDDESLAEGRLPSRTDLDEMLDERPVIVHRYCGHIAMANSAALQLAGVTAATPDPVGGTLDRDESGEPAGVRREMAVGAVCVPVARLAGPAVTDG